MYMLCAFPVVPVIHVHVCHLITLWYSAFFREKATGTSRWDFDLFYCRIFIRTAFRHCTFYSQEADFGIDALLAGDGRLSHSGGRDQHSHYQHRRDPHRPRDTSSRGKSGGASSSWRDRDRGRKGSSSPSSHSSSGSRSYSSYSSTGSSTSGSRSRSSSSGSHSSYSSYTRCCTLYLYWVLIWINALQLHVHEQYMYITNEGQCKTLGAIRCSRA